MFVIYSCASSFTLNFHAHTHTHTLMQNKGFVVAVVAGIFFARDFAS